MRFNFRNVSLGQIHSEDERFRISTPAPVDDLAEAIHRIGLLYPPILFEADPDRYVIVAGFKRVMAWRRLGRMNIEARIIPGNSPACDCLHIAIADNAFYRSLNLIEQSAAVLKLAAFYNSDAELSRAAGISGLAVSPELVARLKKVSVLPSALQKSILSGAISLNIALAIDAMASPLAERLIMVFDQLRPTLNQQKQIVEWVKDLARRDPAAAPDLLADEACRKILSNDDLDRPRKIRALTDILKQRRFPAISAFVEDYRKQMQLLPLPHGAELIPPEDFEAARHRLVLDFHSSAEFENQIDRLQALVRDVNFQALMNKDVAD
jgi:ParB-like chromosome segregation protein Spo0J